MSTENSQNTNSITINSNPATTPKIPFNLDEIFKADVDRFAKLREVLKWILENQESQKSKMFEVETKMVSKYMEIDK